MEHLIREVTLSGLAAQCEEPEIADFLRGHQGEAVAAWARDAYYQLIKQGHSEL